MCRRDAVVVTGIMHGETLGKLGMGLKALRGHLNVVILFSLLLVLSTAENSNVKLPKGKSAVAYCSRKTLQ